MIDFYAFSDEMQKLSSEEERRENIRNALRHSAAAALGTGVGIASGELITRRLGKRHHPKLRQLMKHKATRVGIPAALAAGSAYASKKYQDNLREAYRRVRDEQ